MSNDSVSNINRYLGGGLSYTGPFKSRPNDVAGFAISNAHFGSDYLNANPQPYKNETTYELTYQFEVKPGFIIQPDFQYIKTPSGQFDDAKVFGIRFRIGKDAFSK